MLLFPTLLNIKPGNIAFVSFENQFVLFLKSRFIDLTVCGPLKNLHVDKRDIIFCKDLTICLPWRSRYGSPHHSRSQSVRTPGSKSTVQLQLGPNGIPKNRSNQLSLPQQRSRVASMPNTGVEEEYYRIRQFSITGKGIINRGDSLKSRRSKSNNSVASSNSR